MRATVVGAGLAGCEAAWALANRGVEVTLFEQKPLRRSPAHRADGFAELVCSNSLKAERVESAAGLLKEEMSRLGSLTVAAALSCRVPAGGALAVDRNRFSELVTKKILCHPNIRVVHEICGEIPAQGVVIVATGPLTEGPLAEAIAARCGGYLSFYDAAAPIVSADSVDRSHAFSASRYGRGGADDYLNCPMDREAYEAFYEALLHAECAPLHEFDRPLTVYEGCMPVEQLARRGKDTLRYGPLKPVGLFDPVSGRRPYAVVQLRKENEAGTMLNLVGFQTNLKFGEQKRVFSMIPALHNADFLRYGVMHRNSFLNSPKLLNPNYSLRDEPRIYFAGQLTGVEGYMESAGSGLIAGLSAARRLRGLPLPPLPPETMLGALSLHVSCGPEDFQPMGANFGVLPPIEPHIRKKQERYKALAARALRSLEEYKQNTRFDFETGPAGEIR